MAIEELLGRVRRIYASIDAVQEFDMSKLPAKIRQDEHGVSVFQDFTGGLSKAEVENVANMLIYNIANLEGHLRRWAGKNAKNKSKIDATLLGTKSIQIIKDLSNNDKHGYPPRNTFSGFTPQALNIRRLMRLTTGEGVGSRVAMTLGPGGVPKIMGKGSGRALITGEVVDKNGNVIGDLYDIEMEAVATWEKLFSMLS